MSSHRIARAGSWAALAAGVLGVAVFGYPLTAEGHPWLLILAWLGVAMPGRTASDATLVAA